MILYERTNDGIKTGFDDDLVGLLTVGSLDAAASWYSWHLKRVWYSNDDKKNNNNVNNNNNCIEASRSIVNLAFEMMNGEIDARFGDDVDERLQHLEDRCITALGKSVKKLLDDHDVRFAMMKLLDSKIL